MPIARGLVAVAIAAVAAGWAVSQALPEPAQDALARGQQAAAEALATYTHHLPDSPLWAEALAAGTEAARIAPDHPAPRRFLAQAYLQVDFYARSWSAWQAYLDRGGGVDASVERQLLEVATWMGLNTFDAGRRGQAVPYLETVVRLAPDDLGANARLARLYLDRDQPLEALPYLEALDGRVPELETDVQRIRRIDRYGPEAAAAYASAIEARDAGSLTTALNRFVEATAARPDFTDAWRGVANTAERLGQLQQAEAAHEQVLALSPNDPGALEGLGRIDAEEQQARAEAEAAAQAQAAAEQAAAEQAAAEQAAAERAAAEEEAAQEAAEQAAVEEAAAEREAAERAASERAADAEAAQQAAEEQTDADEAAAEAEREAAEEQAAAERAAAEQAAAERDAADQAAAEQAEADRAAEERAAAEQAAAEQADAEAREREAAEQAAAEQAAEEQAAAERAAESEARAQAESTGTPLPLVDAVAEHRRSAAGASPSVAFVPAPALAVDLADHTGDMIHIRVEVLEKPSDVPVLYQLCLVPTDISVRPACTDPGGLAISNAGTYDAEQPWSDLAGFGGVDWRSGVDSVMAVLRRPDGAPLEPASSGNEGGDSELDAYLPMTVRIQAIAVPPGASFPGWP